MRVAAFDPGLGGAMALLADGAAPIVIPMPTVPVPGGSKRKLDTTAIRVYLTTWKPDIVVIEKQQAMPGKFNRRKKDGSYSPEKEGDDKNHQGVASTFTIGLNYGVLIGICAGLGIPIEIVHPKTWKKAMLSDTTKDKGASVLRAQQLFPGVNLKRTERCKGPDDGMAEALLLAEYGRRLRGAAWN